VETTGQGKPAGAEEPGLLSPPELFAKAAPAVVIIRSFGGSRQLGLGSGFLVEPGNAIVTNEHVVHGASHLEVETHAGKTARLMGVLAVDEDWDLAVLPVPEPLRATPSLKLAAFPPRVGDPVYAIGAPQGLAFTFTQGMVSQIRGPSSAYAGAREKRDAGVVPAIIESVLSAITGQDGPDDDFVIQHDASISPGSSGGPLVNARGEVVGVNTCLLSAKTEGQNLNFAVSSLAVHSVLRRRLYQALTELDGYKEQVSLEESLAAEKRREDAVRDAQIRAIEEMIQGVQREYTRKLELMRRWGTLRSGMSLGEVVKLLGRPSDVGWRNGGAVLAYWYDGVASRGYLAFDGHGRLRFWQAPKDWGIGQE
jgi:hypothetical protein